VHVVHVLCVTAEDAIKAAVKDIKAKRARHSSDSQVDADSTGHKVEATA